MLIRVPTRRTSALGYAPPTLARSGIASKHSSLWSGLAFAYVGLPRRDATGKTVVASSSGIADGFDVRGRTGIYGGSSVAVLDSDPMAGLSEVTLLAAFTPSAIDGNNALLEAGTGTTSATTHWGLWADNSGTGSNVKNCISFDSRIYGSSSNRIESTANSIAVGVPCVSIVRMRGTYAEIWVNGVNVTGYRVSDSNPNVSASMTPQSALRIGSGGLGGFKGALPIVAGWSRYLTDLELRTLSRDPFAPFRFKPFYMPLPTVASAGQSVALFGAINIATAFRGSVDTQQQLRGAIQAQTSTRASLWVEKGITGRMAINATFRAGLGVSKGMNGRVSAAIRSDAVLANQVGLYARLPIRTTLIGACRLSIGLAGRIGVTTDIVGVLSNIVDALMYGEIHISTRMQGALTNRAGGVARIRAQTSHRASVTTNIAGTMDMAVVCRIIGAAAVYQAMQGRIGIATELVGVLGSLTDSGLTTITLHAALKGRIELMPAVRDVLVLNRNTH